MITGIELEATFGSLLALSHATAERVERSVARPLAARFFAARGISKYAALAPEAVFHERDFAGESAAKMDFFYAALFEDAVMVNGNLVHTVKYLFTLDAQMCPEMCSTCGVRYGQVELAGQPVAYVLEFPLAELFALFRTSPADSDFEPLG